MARAPPIVARRRPILDHGHPGLFLVYVPNPEKVRGIGRESEAGAEIATQTFAGVDVRSSECRSALPGTTRVQSRSTIQGENARPSSRASRLPRRAVRPAAL